MYQNYISGPRLQTLALTDTAIIGIDKGNDMWYKKTSTSKVDNNTWDRLGSVSDILSE